MCLKVGEHKDRAELWDGECAADEVGLEHQCKVICQEQMWQSFFCSACEQRPNGSEREPLAAVDRRLIADLELGTGFVIEPALDLFVELCQDSEHCLACEQKRV